ncbi:MAG: LysR family transcriptional regulator [Chloroflexales bacterium]|nr:LysR family transcriptional regulator [Chloroflexales bacterium]
MEFRHLRYFIAVAEELHFGRAAARLQMAQPPLSQQIRQLENEIGVQLLHRTKRRVELTHAGAMFLKEAQAIVAHAEQAIQVAQQASHGKIGRLAVGFVGSAMYSVLPPILRAFHHEAPEVKLTLEELTTAQQIDALHKQHIDVGFLRPPIRDALLSTEPLLHEPLIVALADTHPLAQASVVSIHALAAEPFILFPRSYGPGLYDHVFDLCWQAGFVPQVAQEAIEMHTLVSLVAADLGVALVPASLQQLQRVNVVYRSLQEAVPMIALAMAWRHNDTTPVLHRFLDLVKAQHSAS